MEDESEFLEERIYTKQGAPAEPGLCALCGERPGTECLHNVTAAAGGEPPDPLPDEWVCRPCLEAQMVQGWSENVENIERLIATHPGSRHELEPAAARLAAHLRAEIDRWGLVAPGPVRDFLARYGT